MLLAIQEAPNRFSFFDLIFSGGWANVLIIAVLFGLLIYALYISIERFLIYRAVLKQDDQFVKEVRRNLRDPKKAIALCEQSEHIMASVFRAALNRLDQGKAKDQISLTFETRTTYVVAQLERHLNTLATISGAAPMLGFLGTVIGMVLAFKEMAMSAGQADISQLAGGIYTALTTTIAGLVVGIISYIAYNQLVNVLQRITQQFESMVNAVLEEL